MEENRVSIARQLSMRFADHLAPDGESGSGIGISVTRKLSERATSAALGVPYFEGEEHDDAFAHAVTLRSVLDDVLAATAASFLLSVPVTAIDKSIVQNASGVKPLWGALRDELGGAILRPHRFLRAPEFLMVWGVYTGTYVSANLCDSFAEARTSRVRYSDMGPEEGALSDDNVGGAEFALTKLAATTSTNLALSATKDRTFGRMFGAGPPRPFPLVSWSLFAVRDVMTMGCAFNLPGPIASKLMDFGVGEGTAKGVAQIFPVVLCQFLTTPVHLLSYDIYNKGGRKPIERISFLRREYAKTVIARSIRIAPAFGFGGLGNSFLRDSLKQRRRR